MPDLVDLTDFEKYGVSADVYATLDPTDISSHFAPVSAYAYGFLQSQGTLPLVGDIPEDLKEAVCVIIAERVMFKRGSQQETQDRYAERAKQARAWLQLVSTGKVRPAGLAFSDGSSASKPIAAGFRACSRTPRGFR